MPILDFFSQPDDTIVIGEDTYSIDMRLDTVIRFMYLLEDKSLSPIFKLSKGLELMLDTDLRHLPLEVRIDVLDAVTGHLGGGTKSVTYDKAGNVIPTPYQEQVTDFEQDFDYIYSAFLQTYGIDLLENRDMDYRKFRALLTSLPKGTYYREVLDIRTMDISQYDKKYQAKIRKTKEQFSLKKGGEHERKNNN